MTIIQPSGGSTGSGAVSQIANSTLGASAASFDFQAIAGTFNHLQLILYLRGDTAATLVNVRLRFNNDSAANYDWQRDLASGAAATISESLGTTFIYLGDAPAATATANYFSNTETIIAAYAGTTGEKAAITKGFWPVDNATGNQQVMSVGGKWRTTATAITRVTVSPAAGNFVAGSQATLYGLT